MPFKSFKFIKPTYKFSILVSRKYKSNKICGVAANVFGDWSMDLYYRQSCFFKQLDGVSNFSYVT